MKEVDVYIGKENQQRRSSLSRVEALSEVLDSMGISTNVISGVPMGDTENKFIIDCPSIVDSGVASKYPPVMDMSYVDLDLADVGANININIRPFNVVLKPEFKSKKLKTYPNKTLATDKVSRVFIYFGDLDVPENKSLYRSVKRIVTDAGLEYVRLRRNKNYTGEEIVKKISSCNIAIINGSFTTWECVCLGVPALIIPTRRREIARAMALEDQKAAIQTDRDRLAEHLSILIGNTKLRETLSDNSRALIDGNGVYRVANLVVSRL